MVESLPMTAATKASMTIVTLRQWHHPSNVCLVLLTAILLLVTSIDSTWQLAVN